MPQRETLAADDAVRLERLTLGPYGTNAYLIHCEKTGAMALVDAPAEPAYLTELLRDQDVACVLLTHNHPDHTGALKAVRDMGIPLGAHSQDGQDLLPPPECFLADQEQLTIGHLTVEVLHTPGHTPGSISFLLGNYLLAGDTLFPGGPGRTPSPASFERIIASIRDKILLLPPETVVYPGHGDPTTVGEAQTEYNAFAARGQMPALCGDVLWSQDDEERS